MIRTFADADSESVWFGRRVRSLPLEVQTVARRKLRMINNAHDLRDLRSPPGNRLELLKGDRAGQYSVRINRQWRVCLRWRSGDAHDVQIVDYHG
jgi:toxin HigB-1